MKEQTKQKLIELLETSLTTTDLNIRDLEESLGELLTSTNSCKNSPYIKALGKIYSYVYNSVTYGDWSKEGIIEFIKDTLEEEAAITRQLELDEYHKSLPLKLLQLMVMPSASVLSHVDEDEKGLYVCFRIPYFDSDDGIRRYDEYLVYLNGYPSEYDYVESFIKDHYEKVNKIKEKVRRRNSKS